MNEQRQSMNERCIATRLSILWIARMELKMRSCISRRHQKWLWRKNSCENSFTPL